MRDLYIEIQGTEIPVLSYDIIDGKVVRNNSYYDYQNDLTNIIARKYVDNYHKKSKEEIKETIREISDYYAGSLDLSNGELIDYCVDRYIIHEKDSRYTYSVNYVRDTMINRINEELATTPLITLDYSQELEFDPEFKTICEELRKIMGVLRKDIMNADSIETAEDLGKDLKMLVRNYSQMKRIIVEKIQYKLKDNEEYKKNKTKASSLVPVIVEENLNSYINFEHNTISLGEFLNCSPNETVVKAAVELLEGRKLDNLLKLYSVMNVICSKPNGSIYTDKEKEKALLICYGNILYDDEELAEYYLSSIKKEEEPIDNSRNMRGAHTFKPYYDSEEMDYYGDEEDTREGYSFKK